MKTFRIHPHASAAAAVSCVLTLLLVSPPSTAAAVYSQGWDLPGSTAGWQGNTAASIVDHDNTQGQPAGSLRSTRDPGSPIPTIGANSDQLDALRGNYQGHVWTVGFDLQLAAGVFTDVWLRYRFQGPGFNGWRYAFDVPLDQPGDWFSLAVTFDPSWTDVEATANGWQQDTGDVVSFAQTMSDAYRSEVRLELDPVGTFAVARIDNYFQQHAVPEPASWALVVGAMVALGATRRRAATPRLAGEPA